MAQSDSKTACDLLPELELELQPSQFQLPTQAHTPQQ